MKPSSWHQIRDVLELALELPREDRAGFLDERCAGDGALRAEVESLLEAYARGETYLERPAVELVRRHQRGMSVEAFLEALDEPEAGKRLGGYRISKELDEGGMGTVYLAHREGDEDDLVAIKVAKLGLPSRARRRVRTEARILAELDHPSIARVLDAGTTGDGRPYLVMEYIRGTPIDEYCDEKGLSVEERLEVFIQVCAAVETAHLHGVIHRDVKPSNVLVTEEGVPKLLDFGIAKLLDPAFTVDATGTGERFMTPQFASPEQIRGEAVTPRSDVYSLGALLYKLTTGRLPYLLERYTPHAMDRAFENQAPPWPSEVVAESPAPAWHECRRSDLDFIVMKAICLRPDNRYASVESFSQDLERYLKGEPPAWDETHRIELMTVHRERPSQTEGSAIRSVHQIPPPPADFTGRETELAELLEAVGQGGVTISGLQGMGGVGKTALALKLAEMLAPRYPDGQIYLDLKGVSREPLTPVQAMAHVIHAFHPQAPIPASETGVAGLYRSVLHGQRVLLLMDNAAGPEQVEPLVPPRGCVLLVTSRRSFVLPGLFAKLLDSLPPEDAVALLLRIVPEIGDEARKIADLCGYLPLALRLAGATLAERRDLSPVEYAGRLSEGRGRIELVEASLKLSYELLDEERQRLWRALAVFPDTFDRAAAAAIWDMDTDFAADRLGELVKNGLVDWLDGRYRLHDLARLFGEHRLQEAESFVLRRRHAEHYLDLLGTAKSLYLQGHANIKSGLCLLDTELINVKAGQVWSKANSSYDLSIARSCLDFTLSGTFCLWLRLNLPDRILWDTCALEQARRLGDRFAQGYLLSDLGWTCIASGSPRRALELCDEALETARATADRRTEGICLGNVGVAHIALGEPRRAIDCLVQSRDIFRELAERRCEALNLGQLGVALGYIGEWDRAIDASEEALMIHRELGNAVSEATVFCNLGFVHIALGQHRKATEILERALQEMRDIGDRRGQAYCLDNLASAGLGLGEPRYALGLAAESRSIACDMGERRIEGISTASLGRTYLGIDERRRGVELMEQAIAISQEIGDTNHETLARWHLGRYYEKSGELACAAEQMQKRVDYERSIGHTAARKHAARVNEIRARFQ